MSTFRHIFNAVIGCALIVLLAFLCLQIYRVSTGKTAIYGRDKPLDQAVHSAASTHTMAYASTPEVQQIIGAQPVDPTTLGGNDHQVTFRADSGSIVCTIATDLSQVHSDLVPLPSSSSGKQAQGPGAVCALVHNLPVASGDARSCPSGTLRSSVLGTWKGDHGIGACSSSVLPLTADAKNNPEDGARYQVKALGYGEHVELGSYGCVISGAVATCANLETGEGFSVEENVSYNFFASGSNTSN